MFVSWSSNLPRSEHDTFCNVYVALVAVTNLASLGSMVTRGERCQLVPIVTTGAGSDTNAQCMVMLSDREIV